MGRNNLVLMMAVLLCATMAQAGTRADLSGDVVIPFQTTMNMPLMAIGNLGNRNNTRDGYGRVDYAYNIGKFEVTTGQYTEFLNAVAAEDTYGLYAADMSSGDACRIEQAGSSGSYTYSVATNRADRPVNYVSWLDAARFANWLTNGMPTGVQDLTTTEDGSYFLNGLTEDPSLSVVRKSWQEGGRYYLPSADEWYKAAYHKNDGPTGNYFNYPTGSDSVPSNDLVDPDPGNNANFNDLGSSIGAPYYRTEAGEFENSDSPYGVFDLGGNVHEWTEGVYGSSREIRGGDYGGSSFGMHASQRNDGSPGWVAYGFRIAEVVPEPATMSLLALGGLAVLRRRKK